MCFRRVDWTILYDTQNCFVVIPQECPFCCCCDWCDYWSG